MIWIILYNNVKFRSYTVLFQCYSATIINLVSIYWYTVHSTVPCSLITSQQQHWSHQCTRFVQVLWLLCRPLNWTLIGFYGQISLSVSQWVHTHTHTHTQRPITTTTDPNPIDYVWNVISRNSILILESPFQWLMLAVTLRLTVIQSVCLGVEPRMGLMTIY
jgi:hypothetical protein